MTDVCRQADKVMHLFGSTQRMSEYTGIKMCEIVEWRLPVALGGNGCAIPEDMLPAVVAGASKAGIYLTLADLNTDIW